MSDGKKLIVAEQREVTFYDDLITAVKGEDGDVYVPIRPICDLLSVDWSSQRRRIERDLVLSTVVVTATVAAADGRQREMSALPLRYLNGWLFGISAIRVKNDEVRENLIRYQHDCYQVLFDAFGQNAVTAAPDPLIDELLKGDSPEAQAYQMAMAVANMARQQLSIKAEVERAKSQLTDHENRLQIIEADRGDDNRYVTNSQAIQIAQGVKQIALELSKRSKRNEFGGVYGELHRQFSVPGYKQLPAPKFNEAMNFLRQWWEAITDNGNVPFMRPQWSESVSLIGGGHSPHPIIAADFPPN